MGLLEYVLSSLPGFASLFWQVYEKVLARPKLVISAEGIGRRIEYTPESWAWFACYEEIAWCKPYGTVIRVPVRNTGRAAARNCRAKARFRRSDLRGDTYDPGSWSDLRELHWSENPEAGLDEAYRPITIGRNDTVYVDLLVYHTRLTQHPKTKLCPARIPVEALMRGEPKIGTVLTFYTKPFIRGDLSDNPCSWNPGMEYLKPPLQTRSEVQPNYATFYEIELLVVCDNAQSQARLYTIILYDYESLAIYVWPSLDKLKEALKQGIDKAKPVYRYVRTRSEDPPPYKP